jgi:hypothetical protein
MEDLTCIFLTVNKVPDRWAEYQKKVLLEAIGDTLIITISKKTLDWGTNLIQDEEPSISNIYKQILRGCKLATTPYVAIVEDDMLYHKSHFTFRPPLDTYAYNMHRWGLLTWGKPTYYYKDRVSNGAMIAPRELVISSLEERFSKYPENRIGELGKEKGTSIDRHNTMTFWSDIGVVYLSHKDSLDPTEQHKSKKMSPVQAFRIPYWEESSELIKNWS